MGEVDYEKVFIAAARNAWHWWRACKALGADIDYATKVASTTYGVLGIKVWVFKGEVLGDEAPQMPVGASPRRRASRRPQQFEDRSNEG